MKFITKKLQSSNFISKAKKTFTRLSGEQFKADLHNKLPKVGLFINSGSPIVAEQLSFSGYDWLLVDSQHGPMDHTNLSGMLSAISNGNAVSLVRVGGYADRIGIQQALDSGANGVLVPYVNNAKEAKEAVDCCFYPTRGTRSVYFPQRSTNKDGLLGYVPNSNKNTVVAVQIETADAIKNIDQIVSTPGLDIAFLGRADLCMSMGLFEKYEFPHMYTSKELNEATNHLIDACKKHNKLLGIFLFGTDKVREFIDKGFNFISIGNDLHHVLSANTEFVKHIEDMTQKDKNPWKRRGPCNLI